MGKTLREASNEILYGHPENPTLGEVAQRALAMREAERQPSELSLPNMLSSALGNAVKTTRNEAQKIVDSGVNPYANSLANNVSRAVADAVFDTKKYGNDIINGKLNLAPTEESLRRAQEDRERDEWLQKNQLDTSLGQAIDQTYHANMPDLEQKLYNTIYNNRGRAEAEKFFEEAKPAAMKRASEKNKKYWSKQGEEDPIGTSIVSFASNMAKPAEYLYRLAQKATTGKIDENDLMGRLGTDMTNYGREGASRAAMKAAPALLDPIIRQDMASRGYSEADIAKAIENNHKNNTGIKNAANFLYNTGMSMGDFLIGSGLVRGVNEGTALMSKVAQKLGEFVALTPMGMSAAQDATMNGLERGLTEDQAVVEGIVAGVLEQATEMFSVEALLNPSKSLMKGDKLGYVLKNFFAEGGEEVASDIGNMIADKIIAGDKSELKARMKELLNENKDWDETRAWAVAQAEQIVPDFLGGALSGGILGAAGAKFNSMNNTKMLNEYANAPEGAIDYRNMENLAPVIDAALENDSTSASHQIAQNLQAKVESGQTLTDDDIGGLFQAINEEDVDSMRPKFRDEIRGFLANREFNKYQRDMRDYEEHARNWAEPEDLSAYENFPMSLADSGRLYNAMNERNSELEKVGEGDLAKGEAKLTFRPRSNLKATQEIADTGRLSADELRAKYGGNPATDTVALLTAEMPKQEQYIMNKFYDGKSDPYSYVVAMRDARRAGIAGEDINTLQSSLNEAQKKAAYELGRSDLNELHLRESGKWANGENTRGQVRTVEQGTGFEKNIKGNADSEISSIDLGQHDEVQVTLKDERGRTLTMTYVPVDEGIETKKINAARKKVESLGYQLVLTNGLQSYGKTLARGTIDTENKIMYIQANHPVFNAEQIAKHEEMHERIARGEVDVADVLLRITARFGEDKVNEMLNDYRDAYDGSDMSDEYIIEEIICDANGGMNIFAEANDILARKFAPQLEAVKSETEKSKNGQPNAPPKKRALKLSEETSFEKGVENEVKDIFGDKATVKFSEEARFTSAPTEASDGFKLTKAMSEYMKDSQNRDDKGRLKVMYHGTISGGFSEFKKSDDGLSYFFTDNLKVAKSYSGSEEIINPDRLDFKTLSKYLIGDGWYFGEYEDGYRGSNINTGKKISFNTFEELQEWADKERIGRYNANYAVYLNCINPLIIDAHGAEWHSIPYTSDKTAQEAQKLSEDISRFSEIIRSVIGGSLWSGYEIFDNHGYIVNKLSEVIKDTKKLSELEKLSKKFDDYAERGINLETDKSKGINLLKTRQLAEEAHNNGYDSVIINNVYDSGGIDGAYNFAPSSSVVIVFDSSQVKSVYNENPTQSKDIRFSEESESLAKLRKENKQLQKDLEKSFETIANLKAEMKESNPLKVQMGDAELIAKDLLKRYASGLSRAEMTRRIADIGNYVLNASRDKNITAEEYSNILKSKAIDLAGDMVNSAEELVNTQPEYDEIRRRLMSGVRISPQDKADIPDFNDFRKQNIGNIKITNSGIPVDSLYQELSEMFPYYFPTDITAPSDQLMQMADVINDIRPFYANTYDMYGYDLSEITETLANEILGESAFGQMPPYKTMGDKMKALREERNAYKNKATKAEKLIENLKAKKEEQITKLKESYKKRERNTREKRQAKVLREKIEKHVKALSKKLLSPTKTSHITERQDPKLDSLKATTATILSLINMDSAFNVTEDGRHHAKEGGFPTKKTLAWHKLCSEYEKIVADNTYLTDEALVGENGWLKQIEGFASTPITKLGAEDLEKIYKTLLSLEATLTMSDKAFAAMRGMSISEIVHALFDDNMDKKAHKIYGLGEKHGSDPLDFLNDVSVELLDPHSIFHRLGKSGDKLFRALRNSQDNAIRFYQQAKMWIDENIDVDLDKAGKTTLPVTLGGKTYDLSVAQLMELYVLSNREQAMKHILNGGINLINSSKKKGIITLEASRNDIEDITQAELDKAFLDLATMFPEYKRVADKMQEFSSTVLSKYGNDASMRVYGYEKFPEENYWRIRVDKDHLNSSIENYNNNVTTVGNKGMSKNVNPDATQPIYIDNIFNTFLDQIVDMCDYGSYLEVTEDMNRILNYNNTKERLKTKDIIRHALGTKGEKYWLDLMRDVSNASVSMNSIYGGALNKAVGMFKASAVGGNLRVIVQQPTAILRAMDMIDGKYLAMGVKNPFKGMEKAKQYAPIAQWKDWGYFDMNNGRTLYDLIYDDPSIVKKTSEFLMKGASEADNLAWGILWNAVEAETKAKTNLKVGSEEYYKHCAERFTEIIDSSQVVDGVLQRAGVMRKTDIYSKMATAFMGEPIKQLNQFLNAVYDARNGNGSKKLVLMTVKAMASAAILNAAVKSLIDAMRHSEREKKYWEKFVDEFWGLTGDEKDLAEKIMSAFINGYIGGKGNAFEALDFFQYIPYLRDVESLARGYDVERSDLSVLGSLKKAGESLAKAMSGEGKDTVFSALSTFLGEASKFTGVPAGNVMRDFYSGINAGLNEFGTDYAVYKWNKLFYNIDAVDKRGTKKNKTMYMDLLYNAWVNDHTEDFKLMYEDMKKHFSAKEFQDYWNKKMAEEQGLDGNTKEIEGKVNFKSGDIGKHTTISAEKKAENEKATAEKKEANEKKEELQDDLEMLYDLWAKGDSSFNSQYNELKDDLKAEDFQKLWDEKMKEEQGVNDARKLEGRVNFARGDIGKHTTISAAKKAENEKATALAKEKEALKEEAEANLYSNPTYKQVSNSSVWKQATPDMQKKTEDTIINLQTGSDKSMQGHIDIAKKHGISESDWLLYHLAWQMVDASNYSKQYGKGGANGVADDIEREKAAKMVGLTLAQVKAINKEYSNRK